MEDNLVSFAEEKVRREEEFKSKYSEHQLRMLQYMGLMQTAIQAGDITSIMVIAAKTSRVEGGDPGVSFYYYNMNDQFVVWFLNKVIYQILTKKE